MTHVLRIVLKFNLFKDFSISVIPKILFHCLGREKRHHYPSLVSVLFPFAGAWTRLAGARVASAATDSHAPRRLRAARSPPPTAGQVRSSPAGHGQRPRPPPAAPPPRASLQFLLPLAAAPPPLGKEARVRGGLRRPPPGRPLRRPLDCG